jgi:hypothetical protein
MLFLSFFASSTRKNTSKHAETCLEGALTPIGLQSDEQVRGGFTG